MNSSNVFISGTQIGSDRWLSIDIKKLAQAWLNYTNSQYIVGIPNYGFKLVMNDADTQLTAYSERSNSYTPYISITYSISSNYTLDYAPYKYNDIRDNSNGGKINNFQKRMNCYAYALQMYYRGDISSFADGTCYQSYPGEIGLGQQIPSYITNDIHYFYQLRNAYINWGEYSRTHHYLYFQQFLDEQMKKDAKAMGYSITRILTNQNVEYAQLNEYINTSYNENSERIIGISATDRTDTIQFHFYLRHGNGSCHEHGGNCSIWSDKFNADEVEQTICDASICSQIAYSTFPTSSHNPADYYIQPMFYVTTKNTNVYNSYFYYNHNTYSTGAQFVYNH